MAAKINWTKGRGKLGLLDPLIGNWIAHADSPAGQLECTRSFSRILNGKYVHLSAIWKIPRGNYEESAYIGVDGKGVAFWSFTSDGKHSQGYLTDVTDVHPQAVGFEAQMPAGLARMVYWPDETDGFHWIVESKTQKGWNRFVHHHYHAAE
jgi:hypothetical protein